MREHISTGRTTSRPSASYPCHLPVYCPSLQTCRRKSCLSPLQLRVPSGGTSTSSLERDFRGSKVRMFAVYCYFLPRNHCIYSVLSNMYAPYPSPPAGASPGHASTRKPDDLLKRGLFFQLKEHVRPQRCRVHDPRALRRLCHTISPL